MSNIKDKIKFVNYNIDFLNHSWKWLQDSEIKKLTNTPSFTQQQQQEWFLSLKLKSDYFIRGIKYNKKMIGVVGLKNITKTLGEYWGYIGEKEYWGKGIGKEMISYIINIAKEKDLKIIYLKVNSSNKRAIRLYEKEGFFLNKEKSTTESLYMEYILAVN